jgi:hypothetical protein
MSVSANPCVDRLAQQSFVDGVFFGRSVKAFGVFEHQEHQRPGHRIALLHDPHKADEDVFHGLLPGVQFSHRYFLPACAVSDGNPVVVAAQPSLSVLTVAA